MSQQQHDDEAKRRADGLSYELPFNHGRKWLDMSAYEIEEFLRWHPTYCMTPKQASDWYASVELGIRRDQERHHTGRVTGLGRNYRNVGAEQYNAGGESYYQQEEM